MTERFYLPQIDGLRVIAFAAIYLHHHSFIQPDFFLRRYGWFGVDLSDAISAFLLTTIMVRELRKTGSIDIKNFYFRRVLRIVPLYYFFVFTMLVLFADSIKWDRSFILRVFSQLTLTDNLVSIIRGGWNQTPFALHLWILSAQVQFYIALPLAIWLLRNRNNLERVLIALVVALIAMAARGLVVWAGYDHPFIYLTHIVRPEMFMAGMLIAYFTDAQQVSLKTATVAVVLAAVFGMALYIGYLNDLMVYTYNWWQYLLYGLTAGFIGSLLIVSLGPDSLGVALLKTRVMQYLGKISYGMYVWNLACIAAAVEISKMIDTPWTRYPLALIFTIVLADLSYRLVQLPFLKLKVRRFSTLRTRPL